MGPLTSFLLSQSAGSVGPLQSKLAEKTLTPAEVNRLAEDLVAEWQTNPELKARSLAVIGKGPKDSVSRRDLEMMVRLLHATHSKDAGVLPEFMEKAKREGFIDPRTDDFSKNQAFGRAVGLGILPTFAGAVLTPINPTIGVPLVAGGLGVGALTYGYKLKKFRELQEKGLNPATGKKHDPARIERTRQLVQRIRKNKEDRAAQDELDSQVFEDLGIKKASVFGEYAKHASWTPAKIHQLADQRGVKWDNDAAFMDNCERWTGKRHLDAMSPAQLAAVATALEKTAEVEYHGKTFPGYNKPVASDKKEKKMMVLAKKGDEVKLVHFGQKGYQHNYSPEAKQNYLTRSAGIRNKSGQLTKDDPFSPNYWARKVLWPKGETGHGHNGPVNTEVRMQRKEAGLKEKLVDPLAPARSSDPRIRAEGEFRAKNDMVHGGQFLGQFRGNYKERMQDHVDKATTQEKKASTARDMTTFLAATTVAPALALYLTLPKGTKKKIVEEIRDPRLYSNLRGGLSGETAKERVAAHRHLEPGPHSILSAARAGFTREKKAGLLASLIERKEDEKLAAAFKLAEDREAHKKGWNWKGFREGIRDEGIPMAGMVGGAYLGNRLLPGGSGAVYGSGIGYGGGALANLGLEHVLHKKQQAKTASDSSPSSFIPGAVGATLGAGVAGALTKDEKNKSRNMLAGSAIGYGLADAAMLARELLKKASLFDTIASRKEDEKWAAAAKLAEDNPLHHVAEIGGLGALAAPYAADLLKHRPGVIGGAAKAYDAALGHSAPKAIQHKVELAGLGTLAAPSAYSLGKWGVGKMKGPQQ